mgnify:CR=1 FL=1
MAWATRAFTVTSAARIESFAENVTYRRPSHSPIAVRPTFCTLEPIRPQTDASDQVASYTNHRELSCSDQCHSLQIMLFQPPPVRLLYWGINTAA